MAELFQNYELNKVPWWQRVWRIAAGSVVLHIIIVSVVLYVPAFREAFNIVNTFSNAKYVDEDYNKTAIGERAVLIKASDVFEYPPGYFYNPALDPTQQLAPEIIAAPTPVPLPPMPPPVRQPKIKQTPDALASASPSPSPQASPANELAAAGITENMSKEEQNKKLDEIASRNKIERPNEDVINKRPFKDWLVKAKEAKDKNEIDLTKSIEMTVESDLGPDGKLVNPQITGFTGDERLKPYVTDFFTALSDSNSLSFLKKDVKHIRMVVSLTDKDVTVKISSEVESPDRAMEIARGYGLLLIVGRNTKKGQTEEIIYKNTKVSADGKQVLLNFTMPRKDMTDILTKLATS
ncbi:MAG: hypothetical protein LC731_01255 [Acidobacteria bacterium]|nr:hypothetical protein [Acidobacteriota bacterium]